MGKDEAYVSEISADCKAELDKAIPALMKAEKAVKDLQKKDVDELRSFQKVADAIADCMRLLCIMFKDSKGFAIIKTEEEVKGKKIKIDDWWATAKKFVLTSTLINDMLT